MAQRTASRIWVEVDDYLTYCEGSVTPTGIGRVQAEILPHLAMLAPERIRFCRIGEDAALIQPLRLDDVQALASVDERILGAPAWVREPLKLARYLRLRSRKALNAIGARAATEAFYREASVGDILVNLGASWTHRNFASTVRRLKQERGLRFALLVHDVLPATHPRFCAPDHVPTFTRWMDGMAGVCDLALTPSRSSAESLSSYLRSRRLPVPLVRTVPFGAGWSGSPPARRKPPSERRHVLYVSTIEIRKNHRLLVRVWERLLRVHGPGSIPDLVFAGKWGWEVQDLRRDLRDSEFLGGKVKVLSDLSDRALSALYDDALFTVFPSHCEGWGLPVGESLAHGRACVASNATSIPEVGGDYVDYHDPADEDGAYDLIEALLFSPGLLGRREEAIRARYVAPTWADTARAVLARLDALSVDSWAEGARARAAGAGP